MRSLLFLAMLVLSATVVTAQKTDVIGSDKPITWLGLDFTQTRFMGSANQFKDAGVITAADVRNKYAAGWNELFTTEPKKYDVPKYVHRESVEYALEVTAKANEKISDAFFSKDPGDYSRLKESDIVNAVKKYDFQGKKGVGLLFFVEGMSKDREEASAWITFVDMGSKSVLQTARATGKAGGFGFRNYWAKAFLNILKTTDNHR